LGQLRCQRLSICRLVLVLMLDGFERPPRQGHLLGRQQLGQHGVLR
jgi:hypothetical protein